MATPEVEPGNFWVLQRFSRLLIPVSHRYRSPHRPRLRAPTVTRGAVNSIASVEFAAAEIGSEGTTYATPSSMTTICLHSVLTLSSPADVVNCTKSSISHSTIVVRG